MKRLLLVISAIIFAFSVSANAAEDLGALAKKEKERREALAKQGKKGKTFTNEDIKDLKATLGIEIETPPATEGEAPAAAAPETPATTEPAAEAPDAPEIEKIDQQIQDLREQREQLEKQAQAARQQVGEGGLFHSRAGNLYKDAREAEQKVQEIDKQIQELEKKKQQLSEQPE